MSGELYTIGRAAALCGLSENQLRNYDKTGVISPEVRGDNNYRYYTERQLEQILILKELRSYGIPLRTATDLIKDHSLDSIRLVLEEILLEQREELHRRLSRYDSLVDRIMALNKAGRIRERYGEAAERIEDGFSIIAIAERPVISLRKTSKCHKSQHYTDRYLELQTLIDKQGVKTGRSWFIAYHDTYDCIFDRGEDAEGDMEFFANIEGGGIAAGNTRIFGGFRAACATYLGPYSADAHKETYDALSNWAKGLGHYVSGISYQELIIGRNITDREEEYVTKIYMPLDMTSF